MNAAPVGRPGPDPKPILKWTDELLEDAIAGRTTIYRHGHPEGYRLTAAEREEFERAKERGYVVYGRARKTNLDRVYWEWCQIHGRVIVRLVQLSPKYAQVQLDTYTLPKGHLSAEQMDRIEALFKRHSTRTGPYWVGCDWPSADKVPIDAAHQLAAALWEIAQEPLADRRPQ